MFIAHAVAPLNSATWPFVYPDVPDVPDTTVTPYGVTVDTDFSDVASITNSVLG